MRFYGISSSSLRPTTCLEGGLYAATTSLPCGSVCSCFRRWLAIPPLRPASRASSLVHSWAVPFWCAALPPLLAISRCFARSIEANPRSSLATLTSCDPLTARFDLPALPQSQVASNSGLRVRAVGLQRGCHGSSGKSITLSNNGTYLHTLVNGRADARRGG